MPAKGEDEQEAVAGVLCGGDAGDAEVGDWGGWGWAVWCKVDSLGRVANTFPLPSTLRMLRKVDVVRVLLIMFIGVTCGF